MYVCVYIYIYICICIYNKAIKHAYEQRAPDRGGPNKILRSLVFPSDAILGKGQMGSTLMGSLRIPCFLTEGLFWYSRSN